MKNRLRGEISPHFLPQQEAFTLCNLLLEVDF